MRVKISNPSREVFNLLDALSHCYALGVEYEEGADRIPVDPNDPSGDYNEVPFITLHFPEKHKDKVRPAFASMFWRKRCVILD